MLSKVTRPRPWVSILDLLKNLFKVVFQLQINNLVLLADIFVPEKECQDVLLADPALFLAPCADLPLASARYHHLVSWLPLDNQLLLSGLVCVHFALIHLLDLNTSTQKLCLSQGIVFLPSQIKLKGLVLTFNFINYPSLWCCMDFLSYI